MESRRASRARPRTPAEPGQPNAALRAALAALAAGGPSAAPNPPSSDSGTPSQEDAAEPPQEDAAAPAIDDETFIQAVAAASFVPWCAMQVVRTADGGAEASYQPRAPCGCYFESALGATTSLCQTCGSDADCQPSSGTCRYGYCEVQ